MKKNMFNHQGTKGTKEGKNILGLKKNQKMDGSRISVLNRGYCFVFSVLGALGALVVQMLGRVWFSWCLGGSIVGGAA
jgi:hypothetical protein